LKKRFLAYFRLVDACAQPGCPLCRYVVEASRHYLDALVYEHVNDVDTRRRLRASWGFCNWHAWMLEELTGTAFGAAVIYEDLLRLVTRRVETLRNRSPRQIVAQSLLASLLGIPRLPLLARLYRRRRPCPACEEAAGAEDRGLDTLLTSIGDLQFRRAYESSDGLCMPHGVLAVERGVGRSEAADLLGLTLAKWKGVQRILEGFISKHDYQNSVPFTEEEAEARSRAVAVLAGMPGIFGPDRGARRDRRKPRDLDGEASQPDVDGIACSKLKLRLRDLTEQLSDATSRAAALHYRLSRVLEDRNVLELNLAGERGANQIAQQVMADLRAENEQLRAEIVALQEARLP
jgi:hypothetical protein